MATYDGAIDCFGHDAKATDLGIDFSDKKLSGAAHLLLLGLDECSGNFVAENDALSVQLNARTAMGRKIVNRHELLAVA